MILNEGTLTTLFTAFTAAYKAGFESAPSHWNRVAMRVVSTAREEEYGWIRANAGLREWIGDRVVNKLSMEGFKIKNRKFEHTVSVMRDDVADDRFGVVAPMFNEMGRLARAHPDELVFSLLGSGFAELGFDGQFFFDTDHPVFDANGDVTSVSNVTAGGNPAWYLIDGTKSLKPLIFQEREEYIMQRMDRPGDENVFLREEFLYGIRARVNAGFGLWQLAHASKAELNADNYGAARVAMQRITADGGRKLGISPNLLVVPPELEQTARQLLFGGSRIVATGAPAGDTSHVSVTNEWRESAELIVTPYL